MRHYNIIVEYEPTQPQKSVSYTLPPDETLYEHCERISRGIGVRRVLATQIQEIHCGIWRGGEKS